MEEATNICSGNKEAVSRERDSSNADGVRTQSVCLPFAVMRFDIHLSAIDNPEVASDKNGSYRSFHALCARALARTNKNLDNSITHVNNWLKVLASRERPSKSTSSACFLQTEHPLLLRMLCNISPEECLSKPYYYPNAKIENCWEFAKFI